MRIEYVQDVRCFAVADLDPEAVHQHQAGNVVAGPHSKLSEGGIEVHDVTDALKVLRAGESPKPGWDGAMRA
jgi:hypothetical protein